MKKIMMSAAMLALLATGCQNEVLVEQSQPQEGQLFTLEVGRGISSRTEMGDNNATNWSTDDAIFVSGDNGGVHGVLKFVGYGENKSVATFSGYISGGQPSKLQHIVFPVPEDGKIDMSKRDPEKLDAPMIGTISNGAVQTLNNVGGVLAFQVVGGEGNSYGLTAITNQNQNMTGGHYEFDPAEGTLKYIPGDNVAPIQVNEHDYVYVPIATTTQPTTGGIDNSNMSVNVQVINPITDGVIKSSAINVEGGKIFGDDDTEDTSALEFKTVSEDKADTKWYDSAKTEFEISTAKQLVGFAKIVNEGTDSFKDKTIKLMGDIDLSDNAWLPIGTSDKKFAGTFDGNGKTISNMTIEAEYAAFFGEVAAGTIIKNVSFVNVDINASSYAAAVVCIAEYGVSIENIVVTGEVYSEYGAGGIGAWLINADIRNVTNDANVTGLNRAAGIAGNISGKIYRAMNNGAIESRGAGAAGGIAGIASGATTFEYCFNNENVTTTANNANASAAGILGQTPSAKATFNYCANYGTIIAEKAGAAGIAYSLYGGVTANYCYNAGDITAPTSFAGGIAPKGHFGGDGIAASCINYGVVTGANKKVYQVGSKNTNCYYLEGENLKIVGGNEISAKAALEVLNGGENNDFFALENGKIYVKK